MAEILIVEDVQLQQAIVRQFIESAHTVVESTTTETEAVELAKNHQPDVVIMDITLAEGNGITAAARIKSHSPETKIIMSTARVSDEIKEISQTIPVGEYLTKPYSKSELLNTIERMI